MNSNTQSALAENPEITELHRTFALQKAAFRN